MIIHNCVQGSDEWNRLRIGSIGGSSISKVMSKGEGKTRKSLMLNMVGEMLSGQKPDSFVSGPMRDGLLYEDEARNLYSFITGNEVEEIGCITEGPHKHTSPDGLIGEDGMVEIKTVIPSTFVEYKLSMKTPTDYRRQMLWGLHIAQRKWCDYVVYSPTIKNTMSLIVQRQERDEIEIAAMDKEADEFIADMLEIYEAVK